MEVVVSTSSVKLWVYKPPAAEGPPVSRRSRASPQPPAPGPGASGAGARIRSNDTTAPPLSYFNQSDDKTQILFYIGKYLITYLQCSINKEEERRRNGFIAGPKESVNKLVPSGTVTARYTCERRATRTTDGSRRRDTCRFSVNRRAAMRYRETAARAASPLVKSISEVRVARGEGPELNNPALAGGTWRVWCGAVQAGGESAPRAPRTAVAPRRRAPPLPPAQPDTAHPNATISRRFLCISLLVYPATLVVPESHWVAQ